MGSCLSVIYCKETYNILKNSLFNKKKNKTNNVNFKYDDISIHTAYSQNEFNKPLLNKDKNETNNETNNINNSLYFSTYSKNEESCSSEVFTSALDSTNNL